MPVVTVFIEFFPALRNSKIIIITTGSSYIKKVSSAFARPDSLTIDAFHSFVIILVRHNYIFYRFKKIDFKSRYKYSIVLGLTKFEGINYWER
jgi:hypothetical protein